MHWNYIPRNEEHGKNWSLKPFNCYIRCTTRKHVNGQNWKDGNVHRICGLLLVRLYTRMTFTYLAKVNWLTSNVLLKIKENVIVKQNVFLSVDLWGTLYWVYNLYNVTCFFYIQVKCVDLMDIQKEQNTSRIYMFITQRLTSGQCWTRNENLKWKTYPTLCAIEFLQLERRVSQTIHLQGWIIPNEHMICTSIGVIQVVN